MRNNTLRVFLSLFLLVFTFPAFSQHPNAQGQGQGLGGNLLAEIAALQEQIDANAALIDELQSRFNPDVSGSTYRVYFAFNTNSTLNYVPQNGVSFFNRTSLLTFNEDGTGIWAREECSRYQFTDPDYFENEFNQPLSTIAELNPGSCNALSITWQQNGNELSFGIDGVFSIDDLWVSSSGEVIVKGGNGFVDENPIPPQFCPDDGDLPCTQDYMFQFLRVAVRLD